MKCLNNCTLTTSDGLALHTKSWHPQNPKALILLVHGFSEYFERYEHVIDFFVEKGYAFWAFDRRGHGHSEGTRGHTPSLEAELNDIQMQLDEAKKEFLNLPIFVYGHSQGGNFALNYILRKNPNIQGAVITSPWMKLVEEPSALLKSVASFLQRFFPKIQNKAGIASLARDPEVDKKYLADPLVHRLISIRAAKETMDAGDWLLNYKQPITTPMLLMHGTGDKVVDWKPSEQFFENTGKSIDFELWEGWYYELHNEPEKAKVLGYMLNWLDGHLNE